MAPSKKSANSTAHVKFRDLKAAKKVKGGSSDYYLKIDGVSGDSTTGNSNLTTSTLKVSTPPSSLKL